MVVLVLVVQVLVVQVLVVQVLVVLVLVVLVALVVRTRLHASPDSEGGVTASTPTRHAKKQQQAAPGHALNLGQPALRDAPQPQPSGDGAHGRWGSLGPPRAAGPPSPPGLHPPARK